MTMRLDDVHSRLRATDVARVLRPRNLAELPAALRAAPADGEHPWIAGGRHAMGGRQSAEGPVRIGAVSMDCVPGGDRDRGLLRIEAVADWPKTIAATRAPPGGRAAA